MDRKSRQIFIHGPYGSRQVKEALGDLLMGLILSPDQIWLVSPWVSDFELLDNRTGEWSGVHGEWGMRFVMFSEMLAVAVESGCHLTLVTNADEINDRFYERLTKDLADETAVRRVVSEKLHTKGLLTSSFFLAGSMNFTYSGVGRNEEAVRLSVDNDEIAEARYEFEQWYLK
jgi:phosphatidylserine/phosphatidylglycerophosphate/cardiolipin synthase-like enzyme